MNVGDSFRVLIVAGLGLLSAFSPLPVRALTTGGLGSPWLLERGGQLDVPQAWRGPLRTLTALRRPGQHASQRPTLSVGARWWGAGPASVIPLAQLRANGLRVVVTGLVSRAEVFDWMGVGVDGIVGDRPDVLKSALFDLDADGDGRKGDCLDRQGLPDPACVELRGFAGARGLRPECTLAAVEAALDVGVTALELPVQCTRDGRVVPAVDASVRPGKHRPLTSWAGLSRGMLDGGPPIATLSLAELRGRYDRGVAMPGQPAQTVDPTASPVATAFARARGWSGPYAYASLDEVFRFLDAYHDHHAVGPGRLLPEAGLHSLVASRVRVVAGLPAGDTGAAVGRAVLEVARRGGMLERLTLSTSTPETLATLHREAPRVPVALALP